MTAASISQLRPLREHAAFVKVCGGTRDGRSRVSSVLGRGGLRVATTSAPIAHNIDLTVLLGAGTEAERTRRIRELAGPQAERPVVVIMPTAVVNASLRRAIVAGASGIVLENDVPLALLPTIRAVLAGQLSVPMLMTRQIAPQPLSHREKQILSLVVRGLTNREIAHQLFLAESTIKTHLSSAFRKIDARSRAEAVARIQDPDNGFGQAILAMARELPDS